MPATQINVILAVNDGLVVGALLASDYVGVESSHPFGWKELHKTVPNFDQIDTSVPTEQAERMVHAYAPKRTEKVVHLNITKASAHIRDVGFRYEVQPFVDGDPIDDAYLERRKKGKIIAEYRQDCSEVYVNGEKQD